jgi:hypothetical protein
VWRGWENHEKPVRKTGVLDEIQTEHLRNTNLQRYCYNNLLSMKNQVKKG